MSKGSGPTPDFMGLADKMGQWNLGATNAQTLANRPNQYTPWGSTTWSQAPGGWNGLGGYGGGGSDQGWGDQGHGPGGSSGGPGQGNGPGGSNGPGGPGSGGGGGATGGGGGTGGGPGTGPALPVAGPGGYSNGPSYDLPNGPGGRLNPLGGGPAPSDAGFGGTPDFALPPGVDAPNGPGGNPNWTGNPNAGGGQGYSGGGQQWDPASTGMPGQWSQTTTLNPELQAAADAQMKLQNQRSGFGLQQFGQLSDAMKNPFSLGGLPGGGQALDPNSLGALDSGMAGRNRAEDALYGRATSRLDPQWNQREQQMQTQLANQGLSPTSQAYQTEMGNFNRSRNDAYDQARLGAQAGGGQEQALQFGMGLQGNQQKLGAQAQGYGQAEQTRGRTLSEMLQQRELPVNEMNALMNGQNVQMPQFGPFMGAGAAQSPNYLGAGQAMGNYNLGNAQAQNAMWGDIGQGAGSMAAFLPFLLSDERAKTNIRRLPVEIVHGVPLALYEWRHSPGRQEIGVIAQDVLKVKPEAVVVGADGLLRVAYHMLGST